MLILVDSNYLSHFNSFRNEGFTHDGRPTGVVFGFLKSVLSLSRTFGTNRFVFVWDSRRSLRKIEFPGYKKREEKSAEEKIRLLETIKQMVELRTEILPKFGFRNIFQKTGYEGDDLIAGICQENIHEEIAIVSSDNDLYQCLSLGPIRFMYGIKNRKKYTRNDFTKEYGIWPRQWAEVKSLAGCAGDTVPGVPMVGVKTAIRYVKGELPEKSKAFQDIERAKKDGTVANTRLLVELPYPGLEHFGLEKTEVFEVDDFLSICDEFGFRSFERDELVWRAQFNMKVGREG